MNESNPAPDANGCSLTVDCVDFWLDGPGDTTVRPIPPERIEQARALRDRILAAEAAGMDLSQQVFLLDGPGDHTVRPIPPERLDHAKAERAKILAAKAAQEKAPSQNLREPRPNS